MTTGIYIAGVVLTILTMACLQEGGAWMFGGITCVIGIIVFGIISFNEDMKNSSHRN